ncbi:MAG: hypothetical protein U5L96_08455 [Owenweeksia sp.]|nr:hypothetical protein [Owenweeksia sp.]
MIKASFARIIGSSLLLCFYYGQAQQTESRFRIGFYNLENLFDTENDSAHL